MNIPAAAATLPDEQQPEAQAARPSAPVVPLTAEQRQVAERVLADLRKPGAQVTLGGYAGTGKTTLIRALMRELRGYAVCAYTGKAANVLRRKGVPASTIHSLIYRIDEDTGGWRLKDGLDCHGIIVDEASMVSEDIYRDLLRFRLPILFVGDHGQLEPVGSRFNLMASPQYRLEQIHRNAGAIIAFADALRRGGLEAVRAWTPSEEIQMVLKRHCLVTQLVEADQVCVGFNSTRVRVNQYVRKALNRTGTVVVGERVMCLRNDREAGVFNGMQGVVAALRPRDRFDLAVDGYTLRDLEYDPAQFGQEKTPEYVRGPGPLLFDYAYGATCHKLQGDEADTVLVYVEQVRGCDMKRWAYTAATRARKRLIWMTE